MPEIAQNIRSVRKEIMLVRKMIQQRIDRLLWLRKNRIPGTQPFLRLEKVHTTEAFIQRSQAYLSNPQPYQKELEEQIRQLRKLLRNLQVTRQKLHSATIRIKIERSKQKIGKSLKDIEKKMFHNENIDPGTWATIRETLRQNTNRALSLVKRIPSRQNIKRALTTYADEMAASECTGERFFSVNNTITQAILSRLDRAEQHFRSNPTYENFEKMYNELEMAQMFQSDVKLKHAGWSPVNAVRHTLEKGDTLSEISLKYYGKACFWDIIFIENARMFGPGFTLLPTTKELIIP